MDNLTLPTLIVVMLVIAGVVAGVSWLLVGRVTQKALSDVLGKLSEEAVIEREAAARFAADAAAETAAKTLKAQNDLLFDEKKDEIDGKLVEAERKVAELMSSVNQTFGKVDTRLESLTQQTTTLSKVLHNPRERGSWGERIAEDILRAIGFVENVNYTKQVSGTAQDGSSVEKGQLRPDYEIKFPPDRILIMDVKFPLENYTAYLDAADEERAATARAAFAADVKRHVKALASKDYRNKVKDGEPLDIVLLFVPNESLTAFIHETDPSIIEEALKVKVVLCSPLALFAYLSVVHQATESFHTQQNLAEVMKRINWFKRDWEAYAKSLGGLGKKVEDIVGELKSLTDPDGTRHRMLGVQIREIEKARKRMGVSEFTEGEIAALSAAGAGDDVIEGELMSPDDDES